MKLSLRVIALFLALLLLSGCTFEFPLDFSDGTLTESESEDIFYSGDTPSSSTENESESASASESSTEESTTESSTENTETDREEEILLGVTGACVLSVPTTGTVRWSVSGSAVTVDASGLLVASKTGTATVTATFGSREKIFYVTVRPDSEIADRWACDPYVGVSKNNFYASYSPAESFIDAYYRTRHSLLSGEDTLPAKAPTVASNRPKKNGRLIRNATMTYEDNGNTYVVYDYRGNVAFKIYKGAAYITLEEVAAYMFAFGGEDGAFPANHTSSKSTKPSSSPWGKYLRVNHSYFSGDTEKYPKEPELPNIKGCGGTLQYWEMDIGPSGYNNGSKITRGTCRVVYGRNDLNGDGVYSQNELHVFYTYNHYSDFQEYLNYENGWGEIFGYETNGSSSSKGPSPYIPVEFVALATPVATVMRLDYCLPERHWLFAA